MNRIKKAILVLSVLVCVVGVCLNVHADEVYKRALIKGKKATFTIDKSEGTVLNGTVNNKRVKLSKRGNKITLKGIRKGSSVVTIKTSKKSIKYYVYVAKQEVFKSGKPKKTAIKLVEVNKSNHNIVLRLKVTSATSEGVEYECEYNLQKKMGRKWKKVTTDMCVADTAYGIRGKGSVEFSYLLSNYYDNLENGKYRLGYLLDGKRKYVKFRIK